MQLVVLAAGHGRRFGGLKQLVAVGPGGETLMDYTARDALAAGFDGVILIVREEIQDEL
ncbi:MAG: NTP transferase domain-containing protein, partial [Acidimicrobiales bacterium]